MEGAEPHRPFRDRRRPGSDRKDLQRRGRRLAHGEATFDRARPGPRRHRSPSVGVRALKGEKPGRAPPYLGRCFTPVLRDRPPRSGGEIGRRFPAYPSQRHLGTFLIAPRRHLMQRAPREVPPDADLADLDRLIRHSRGNQHARQFVGRFVTGLARIALTVNLALSLIQARPPRCAGAFQRPLQDPDHPCPLSLVGVSCAQCRPGVVAVAAPDCARKLPK